VTPNARRNGAEKWLWLENPSSSASAVRDPRKNKLLLRRRKEEH
jgi:hypothetical protein